MAEWVKVANTGGEMALVGDKYLFPGERREVLREYFERARGRYPQVVEVKVEAVSIPEEKANPQPFTGLTFVLAGNFDIGRDTLADGIRDLGGTVTTELTAGVSYLVAGVSPGKKAAQAEKLGVPVITEAELQQMGKAG